MATIQLPDLCLGIPIDHRLEPLLGTELTSSDRFAGLGSHAQAIESYGRDLQKFRGDISDNEVKFANWLAMPETKGGVVIVLLQPAEHQRYFVNHPRTVKDCDTLEAIDEVCRAVTGSGLEKISCFDAFPFQKTPVGISMDKSEEDLDGAYAVFLDMIQQKQPDVVFSCYRSPHSTKYKDFQCIGVGGTRDYPVNLRGQHYTCVNGFHPSYALNYLEDKSALRNLFIIEATQAFRRANGTWNPSSWMNDVRKNCAEIRKIDTENRQKRPRCSKHDFQQERFHLHMDMIAKFLGSLKSGTYDDMTDDELYDLVVRDRYNLLFPNSLLLLVKIIRFEDSGGDRLEDKGFSQIRQREERDVRDLRRNVEKRCDEFLRSLREDGAPFQIEKGGIGLFTSAGLDKSLSPLGPFPHQSGFHSNLRLSFLKLVRILNGAYTYRGRDVYDVDRNELARAFRLAATHLEWALAQHAASTRKRDPEQDLAILSQFNSLSISNGSSPQGRYTGRTRFSQTRPSPGLSSAYTQPRPFATPQLPSPVIAPSSSQAAVPRWSPPAPPSFGTVSTIPSPQGAKPSRYRSPPTCKSCKQTGHYAPSCPQAQCFKCKGFGHMTFDCPQSSSTSQRRR